MKIADIAIRRPVFITSIVILMIAAGLISLSRLPVDMFPNVELPYLAVSVIYPGAGPEEMEKLVLKPLEEEVRTIPGVRKFEAFAREGIGVVWAEFPLESDPKYCEQQLRDRVALARAKMPKGIEEPVIRRHSISDQPILSVAVKGWSDPRHLYGIVETKIKPRIEQVDNVSQVKVFGGSRRELRVLLDRERLDASELSLSQVLSSLRMGGQNIPLGKHDDASDRSREIVYRSIGEYNTLDDVRDVIVKFYGNDVPVRLGQVSQVTDTFKELTSYSFLNGEETLLLEIYRQSGANTVAVTENVKKRITALSKELSELYPGLNFTILRDGARSIRNNLNDVREAILWGILLTVVVVFFFLGNLRSTIITGIAIPNSLIGAFIFVSLAGFTLNLLTLVALSLAVGLLIDDAIVVRENIFRHLEKGKPAFQAASEGTHEVGLAVIATTLAILAVFGPIAFIGGIPGKFLREFGLTVCFIMMISLFDALTVGPMLSARFLEPRARNPGPILAAWNATVQKAADAFGRFQDRLRDWYGGVAAWCVDNPGKVLLAGLVVLALSSLTFPFIPKTFVPTPDMGEMQVVMKFDPGQNLETSRAKALEVDRLIRSNREVLYTSLVVGDENGDASVANIYLRLVGRSHRKLNTTGFKAVLRKQLARFSAYRIEVRNFDNMFGGQRPFIITLRSEDPTLLESAAKKVLETVRREPRFIECDYNLARGKPEMRVVYDLDKTKLYGISTTMAGAELRGQIEGEVPAQLRQSGEEWDIRVRMRDEDRDFAREFDSVRVMNMNGRLVNLARVAKLVPEDGPSVIYRYNGQRVIEVSSDLGPGYGIGDLLQWIKARIRQGDLLPAGVTYSFGEESEIYQEMARNFTLAAFLAVLFIFLVLASLYESFVTPFGLLLPLPMAIAGAFVALWIGRQSLNIFSIISVIMLLGVAAKNSILLIDFTNQLVAKGLGLRDALIEAGRTRLRPILMTSMALIAGTLPLAIGLSESAKQRSSMGYVIIGGVISSTVLSLILVPAALSFFNRRRRRAPPQA